ncbi:hypothetical protein KIL84_019428, partial [Mauremys mutica]
MLSDFKTSYRDTEDLDEEKSIAFFLDELDTLRTHNNKLQGKLVEKNKELKTIEVDLELQERAPEVKTAKKTAVL